MFDSTTTTDEVIAGHDLTGVRAVVTGATGGLGLETARTLASAGASVVIVGRDAAKAEQAQKAVGGAVPGADLGTELIDLADLASVRAGAARLAAGEPIDLLVNNAGVMACPFGRTADGFEMQFGTNHLGHFVLTGHLFPSLLAGGARVVNVSSHGHHFSGVDFEDPNFEQRPYDKWVAYGQSKTANILFTLESEERWGGQGVHSWAVHPGMVATDLGRHMTAEDLELLSAMRERAGRTDTANDLSRMKQVDTGAATTVLACVSTDIPAGSYLADCAVSPDLSDHASDLEAAQQLWALSERLVGETIPPE